MVDAVGATSANQALIWNADVHEQGSKRGLAKNCRRRAGCRLYGALDRGRADQRALLAFRLELGAALEVDAELRGADEIVGRIHAGHVFTSLATRLASLLAQPSAT
jgi:hypothetical protein